MAQRESKVQAARRWEKLEKVRKKYPTFESFLVAVMDLFGFQCTPLQIDISRFICDPAIKRKMVQAQRGQAKTTITGAYAVYKLIFNPSTRVLIFSAGEDMANQIGTLIYQIIHTMDDLECMRPDRSCGDRTSVEAFDVHYSLKGPDKSPSVASLGITSNMQGPRADVLIADDIESTKNSLTALNRERLLHLTRDFTSICSNGEIIFLGTPQSTESVYNGLPSRGYQVRIWTGRFPTEEELPNYGDFLAPSILRALRKRPELQTGGGPTGTRGQPTDPVILPEDVLTAKEIDQGAAYFQLQHMLDTKLMDADRYPLKADKLIFFSPSGLRVPCLLNRFTGEVDRIHPPSGFPLQEKFYRGRPEEGSQWQEFSGTHMYVDPSGGGKNGDELAFAVSSWGGGYVTLRKVGGMPGGLDQDRLDFLTEIAVEFKPDQIDVEENFGKGAFKHVWMPHLLKRHKCSVVDVWETGQKELRIIDTLEPVIGSGRFVVDEAVLADDWRRCQQYPAQDRAIYSFFFQLARVTREKGALRHDDRLDAVAGTFRHWVDRLAIDSNRENARAKSAEWRALMRNPLGNGRKLQNLPFRSPGNPRVGLNVRGPSVMDKFRKRPNG